MFPLVITVGPWTLQVSPIWSHIRWTMLEVSLPDDIINNSSLSKIWLGHISQGGNEEPAWLHLEDRNHFVINNKFPWNVRTKFLFLSFCFLEPGQFVYKSTLTCSVKLAPIGSQGTTDKRCGLVGGRMLKLVLSAISPTPVCLPVSPHASLHDDNGLNLWTVSQLQLNVFLCRSYCGHGVSSQQWKP